MFCFYFYVMHCVYQKCFMLKVLSSLYEFSQMKSLMTVVLPCSQINQSAYGNLEIVPHHCCSYASLPEKVTPPLCITFHQEKFLFSAQILGQNLTTCATRCLSLWRKLKFHGLYSNFPPSSKTFANRAAQCAKKMSMILIFKVGLLLFDIM